MVGTKKDSDELVKGMRKMLSMLETSGFDINEAAAVMVSTGAACLTNKRGKAVAMKVLRDVAEQVKNAK